MNGWQVSRTWDLVQSLDPEPLHLVRALELHCTGQDVARCQTPGAAGVADCFWYDSYALAAEFCLR